LWTPDPPAEGLGLALASFGFSKENL